MQYQDAQDPTGVNGPDQSRGPGDRATVRAARRRKADAAVEMKMAGATWAEIALTLGYPTPRQALVATEQALARRLDEQDREQMRSMAGKRLERLLRAVWSKAIDPDNPEQMIAVAKCRDIIDRHAKLFGLDAPTEVIVHSPTLAEIETWVATVLSSGQPPVAEYDIIAGEITHEATG